MDRNADIIVGILQIGQQTEMCYSYPNSFGNRVATPLRWCGHTLRAKQHVRISHFRRDPSGIFRFRFSHFAAGCGRNTTYTLLKFPTTGPIVALISFFFLDLFTYVRISQPNCWCGHTRRHLIIMRVQRLL